MNFQHQPNSRNARRVLFDIDLRFLVTAAAFATTPF
jgi:hypothetical protein